MENKLETKGVLKMERNEKKDSKIARFTYFWTRSAVQDPKYTKRTKLIKRGFSSFFHKTLIVTSTLSYPSPGFIVEALSITDNEVEIRHTWKSSESTSLAWSGSLALYKHWKDLENAAEYIVKHFGDIRVLWFPDIVNLLIIAERSHKLFDVGFSKIIIKGPRSFEIDELSDFKRKLAEFGEVKKIKLFKGKTEFGKIAVVEYRFATHAFVAKFHLNGMVYEDLGFLHVEVVITEKERSVRNEVMRRVTEYFESSHLQKSLDQCSKKV